ncbi:MAG: hypothetical protein JSU86_00590 [Phycisphaerales bacterium]|nr:MAG: hypothetical protein JSU86_00590 [Phycisphaerales bacterium]
MPGSATDRGMPADDECNISPNYRGFARSPQVKRNKLYRCREGVAAIIGPSA